MSNDLASQPFYMVDKMGWIDPADEMPEPNEPIMMAIERDGGKRTGFGHHDGKNWIEQLEHVTTFVDESIYTVVKWKKIY